jgi:tetratricopeptide (TPR) repeat protein
MDRDTRSRRSTGRPRPARSPKGRSGAATAIRPAVTAAPAEPTVSVAAGEKLLSAGDWTGALATFLELRRRRPRDPRVTGGFAKALAALGNRRLAAGVLGEHLARRPDDAAAWWQLAEIRQSAGERVEMLAALERVAALDPGRTDALLWMARTWWALGNGDLARRRVRECLHLAPRSADAHYLLGVIFEKWGRLGDALRELRLARELECDADDLPGRIAALSDTLATDRQAVARLTRETSVAHPEPRRLYDLAKYHVRTGDLAAALEICDRMAAANPSAGEFLELRARILVEDDRPEEGLAAAEEAARAADDPGLLLLYRRRVENRFGPPAERLRFYEAAVRRCPERVENYLNLGRLQGFADPGDAPGFGTQAALHSFAEGLKLAPDHPGLLEHRGDVLARAGRFVEAAESYRAALEERPDSARLHDRLGVVLMARGDLDAARQQFRRALDLQSQYDRPHLHLGRAAEAAADHDAAAASYRQALRFNRRNVEARLRLAGVLRRQGRNEEAEELVRQILGEHPDLPDALAALAGLADLRGRPDEAEALYRRALEILAAPPAPRAFAPETPVTAAEVRRELGLHLARRGRPREALEHLTAAAQSGGDDPDLGERLAAVLLELGRRAAGERLLRRVLAEEPDRTSARVMLAELLLDAGRVAAAVREARHLVETVPTSASAWTLLGRCRAAVRRWQEAAGCFRAALERDPRRPEAVEGLLAAAEHPEAGVAPDERRRWLLRSLAFAAGDAALAKRLAALDK